MPSSIVTKIWNQALSDGSSSSNMAINGAVTPVEFLLSAEDGYDCDIHMMCLIAEFTGPLASGNKFIMESISALTNGLLIEAKLADSLLTICNSKRTRDLIEVSVPNGINVVSGSPSLLQVFFYLPPYARICKQGSFAVDDFVKATVRDNLSRISFLKIFLQGIKI